MCTSWSGPSALPLMNPEIETPTRSPGVSATTTRCARSCECCCQAGRGASLVEARKRSSTCTSCTESVMTLTSLRQASSIVLPHALRAAPRMPASTPCSTTTIAEGIAKLREVTRRCWLMPSMSSPAVATSTSTSATLMQSSTPSSSRPASTSVTRAPATVAHTGPSAPTACAPSAPPTGSLALESTCPLAPATLAAFVMAM
mmetsp:Transcript_25209/g.61981  ORF Transcript_25209/g.61981 Transcript_25209/m.61981 type:complete len:202 (-) Transcript_25209:558-1163(-)